MHAMNSRTKVWLHSMTPRQEVSKFLCNRAILLRHEQRFQEALRALGAAERFDPDNPAPAEIRRHMEQLISGGKIWFLFHKNPMVDAVGTQPIISSAPLFDPVLGIVFSPVRSAVHLGPDQLSGALDPFPNHSRIPKALRIATGRASGQASSSDCSPQTKLKGKEHLQ
jgi:hypothetical protein